MNAPLLAVRQVHYENRAFWRNPAAAFFTVILPLLFLVLFNAIFGDDEIDIEGGRADISAFYVPGIAALAVISASYTNLGMMVTIARGQGVLKRVRGTPLPPWAYLFGRIAQAVLLSYILVAVVLVAGEIFYDVDVPAGNLPALLLTVLVGAASFSALGLAISGFIPNADAAPAIVNGTILPLLFISDVFIPLQDPPGWLDTLGDLFPVKHFSEALQATLNPYTTGSGLDTTDLAVVAVWGIAGALTALRFFSWEPRR